MPTDITRRGSRDYDNQQHDRVIAAFHQLCRNGNAIQVEDLAHMSRVPGRTVRQIMTDADGVEFLLGGGDEGYRIAEWQEDAAVLTRRLRSQAFTLMERVQRREQAERNMQQRQTSLL